MAKAEVATTVRRVPPTRSAASTSADLPAVTWFPPLVPVGCLLCYSWCSVAV